jgi:alkyl hydroperoxide reductase subunit AhpC
MKHVLIALLACAYFVLANPVSMEGKQVPNVTFKTRIKEGDSFVWKDLSTDDVFKGKKVVVFSLPGAFTPTCSSQRKFMSVLSLIL